VQPAKCTRRMAISMKNSTYTRWSQIVSTVKKSTATKLGRPKCGPVDVAPQDVKLVAQHHNLELFEFSRSEQQVN
jgi:hypothetical protein